MKKQRNVSMDGFVTRRPQRSLLNERAKNNPQTTVGHMRVDRRENTRVHAGDSQDNVQVQSGHGGDIKQYIGESLQEIDLEANADKGKKVKRRRRKLIFKLAGLILGLVALVVVGFLLYKAWEVGCRVYMCGVLNFHVK